MLPNLIIRPYEQNDRPAVRQISCDTADCGNPVESFFSDREVIADLLTCYYTDYEPQALWVADYNGQAVGYLTGCLNTNHYSRMMTFCIVPKIFISAILRGIIWRRETWRMLRAGIKTLRLGGFFKHIPAKKYPAHLHVNIKKDFRSQHIGDILIGAFIKQVKEADLKGIHLSVREDNVPACRFFERLGFKILNRYPALLPYGKTFQIHYTLIYGMEVI